MFFEQQILGQYRIAPMPISNFANNVRAKSSKHSFTVGSASEWQEFPAYSSSENGNSMPSMAANALAAALCSACFLFLPQAGANERLSI